jgi:RecA/RadA recombinase
MCTQLAVDVGIPEIFGGVGGEALYVDTEGSFSLDRAHDMASALLVHLNSIPDRTRAHDPESADKQAALLRAEYNDTDAVLKHIHYCRVHDYAEQLALVRTIPSLLEASGGGGGGADGEDRPSRIRLVVIDSVAFHFRHGFANSMSERTRLLNGHAQLLNALASQYGVAVVVSNQMTTRIGSNGGGDGGGGGGGGGGADGSSLVPALGESWSHAITNRLELKNSGRVADCTRILPTSIPHQRNSAIGVGPGSAEGADETRPDNDDDARAEVEAKAVLASAYERLSVREASLVKSPSRMAATASFVIVQQGLRKVPRPRSSNNNNSNNNYNNNWH